ncbi:MAG: MFS transporter [Parachlamydiales bacterium]|jgi:DHA1 family bicyclomycin/chloramphenicol resistance-like MFS transporter
MNKTELKYITLIIAIIIAACVETDIYLPAFPDMMAFFQVSETEIQQVLTWNFLGICIAGPFYGPLSDSIGRRLPLLWALLIFFIGSIFTFISDNYNILLAGRLLQGIGSGGCFTLGTAVIFDAFQKENAMRAMNYLNFSIPFIMAGAPMLGGFLNSEYGFRSNFIAIGILVGFSLLYCLFCFKETLAPQQRAPFNFTKFRKDFAKVLGSASFWQLTLIFNLAFSGYIAFLSSISVFFVTKLGVSKDILPFYQCALLGAWLIASITCSRLMKHWGAPFMKKMSSVFIVIGGIGLALGMIIDPLSTYIPTASMMIYTAGINWILSTYFPESMELFPDIKGVAASILTSLRLLITVFVIGLVNLFYNETIYPISGMVIGIILTMLPLMYLYERKTALLQSAN